VDQARQGSGDSAGIKGALRREGSDHGNWIAGIASKTCRISGLKAAAARNEIAARNERLRAELDRIKKPSKLQEHSELIKELTLFSQQSSLKKFVYKQSMMPVNGDLYCEMPLTLTFEGDFTNIFNFIRSTEEMRRLTRIRSMSLKSKDLSGGKVQAQVALNIYYTAE